MLGVRTRSVLFDAAIAAVVLAAGQAEAWQGTFSTRLQGPHWAEAAGYAVASVALAFRRMYPLPATLAVCAGLSGEWTVFGAPEGW